MKIEGIITPIVTPFKRDESQSINYEALRQLIDNLIIKGVSGIFILGSNGEFHVVSDEETVQMTEKTVEFVNGRVPVYVGVGRNSTHEVIKLSQEVEKAGADALSILPPYYISPTDKEVINHYQLIAESTNLPIVLYNIPKATKINLSKEVVHTLSKLKNIVAIKDSSGDMDNLKGYVEACEGSDMKVLIGSDSKIAQAIKLGAAGAIAGTSNAIPDHVISLYQALMNKEYEEADKLQEDIEQIRNVLKLETVPAVLKRAVEWQGIQVGPARLPVMEVSHETDERIKEMLDYYGLKYISDLF